MNLKDRVQLFKENNPDRLEHTFKNGVKFKGFEKYRLYWFIDGIYKDAVNEWVSFGTKNNVSFLEEIIK